MWIFLREQGNISFVNTLHTKKVNFTAMKAYGDSRVFKLLLVYLSSCLAMISLGWDSLPKSQSTCPETWIKSQDSRAFGQVNYYHLTSVPSAVNGDRTSHGLL